MRERNRKRDGQIKQLCAKIEEKKKQEIQEKEQEIKNLRAKMSQKKSI